MFQHRRENRRAKVLRGTTASHPAESCVHERGVARRARPMQHAALRRRSARARRARCRPRARRVPLVPRRPRDIDLAVHAQPRSIDEPQLRKHELGRLQVLGALRIRGVDQLDQQLRARRLLESGAKRGEQRFGHVPDQGPPCRSRSRPHPRAGAGVASADRAFANSRSSASTSALVRAFRSVLLPAFV